MWYLIVPPIIIVLCIAFLLWYLSKKANDPRVSERVQELGASAGPVHFSGVREFFLRLLEKFAQRSKTRSLRMHNAMHNWLQSIRASRKKVTESRVQNEVGYSAFEEEVNKSEPEAPVFVRTTTSNEEKGAAPEKPIESLVQEVSLERPILRRRLQKEEGEKVTPIATERVERPMVSEHVARPEMQSDMRRRRTTKSASPEEGLIGQIATNPKDFAAYEALGDYYMETGNIKDAKECYRQVLKLSPVHRMVKIKIRRLEKLLGQKA